MSAIYRTPHVQVRILNNPSSTFCVRPGVSSVFVQEDPAQMLNHLTLNAVQLRLCGHELNFGVKTLTP